MEAYSLLSTPVKKFIRDKKWGSLRPIQKAAIVKIITTKNNYILAARTASGKTEAAFLPILSMVNFSEPGVQVLYISPLVALINDQFERVNELSKHLDINITKWHGEASRSAKKKLVENPNGIVLITPESIEAMFANRPYYINALFANLKFVVIDEIHSFLGTDRGIQLKSLLYRINEKAISNIRFVALSATLGNYYDDAKSFFGDIEHTKVLLDSTKQPVKASIKYFGSEATDVPIELLGMLYKNTQKNRTLIFPNSRGRVEEIAVKLKKIAAKYGGHQSYFAHHASVNKELREFIEHFAKTNDTKKYAIVCTSTLELGIDIGSVDQVAQIDSTFSVASLAQRLGRSGRKEGIDSNLLLCALSEWSLLQSIACYELLKEGFVEQLKNKRYSVDLLFHQILSITKEHSGINKDFLFKKVRQNYTFEFIPDDDIISLLKHMIREEYLENINGELIIGLEGEKLVNSRDFYTAFQTPTLFKVVTKNRVIGEVPPSIQIVEDQNIFLAAKIWKIKEVDYTAKKVFVIKAVDGKKPMFFGGGGEIHERVRKKMLDLIKGNQSLDECDENARNKVLELRNDFKNFKVKDLNIERPVFCSEGKLKFYSFTGTKINNTLFFLFEHYLKKNISLFSPSSLFESNISYEEFTSIVDKITASIKNFHTLLFEYLEEDDNEFPVSKWGFYLPKEMKQKMILTSHFDLEGTVGYLLSLKLVKV